MSQITDVSVVTGSKGSIGATALLLTATTGIRLKRGVTIKADPTNTGTVYVGLVGVTADTAEATDGFPLEAGASVDFEIRDPRLVYVIASVADQKVFFLGV